MTRLDKVSSRAAVGGCHWYEHEQFTAEYDSLVEEDEVAASFFETLMERAEGRGLGPEDYKAPIGGALKRLNKPWIAEFVTDSMKVSKNGTYTQYRLYWGEAPVDEPSALLACLVGGKPAGRQVKKSVWFPKQNRHITFAIDRLLAWCRQESCNCRMLR